MLSKYFLFFSEGSNLTPAHHYPDFRFKTYAPLAFRYFRELFGIKPDDYLVTQMFFAFYKDIQMNNTKVYFLKAFYSLLEC